MFNSGQSCCGIERIYVHASVYDTFVEEFANVAKQYKLGDPREKTTNLGPVVSVASAERIRKQVKDAIAAGAKELVGQEGFEAEKEGNAFVGPKVLVDVTHEMDVMMEEVSAIPVSSISSADRFSGIDLWPSRWNHEG
jgi:acyl-CoA reductase-like NAD-dependent aldehyde dehydrogenase